MPVSNVEFHGGFDLHNIALAGQPKQIDTQDQVRLENALADAEKFGTTPLATLRRCTTLSNGTVDNDIVMDTSLLVPPPPGLGYYKVGDIHMRPDETGTVTVPLPKPPQVMILFDMSLPVDVSPPPLQPTARQEQHYDLPPHAVLLFGQWQQNDSIYKITNGVIYSPPRSDQPSGQPLQTAPGAKNPRILVPIN